jgi:hypothetical protein
MKLVALAITGLALGCGGRTVASPSPDASTEVAPDADAGCDFVYSDRLCSVPIDGDASGGCGEKGDGLCYQKCTTEAECHDPTRPHCSVLGLFNSGDYNCNRKVRICRAKATDDCP